MDYVLPDNVEYLELLRGAVRGVGNALNNYLIGNPNNNFLDGGAGADEMQAGYGNDIYIIDNSADTIYDLGGYDIVRSSASYDALASSQRFGVTWAIEELQLTTCSHLSYRDSDRACKISGNSGNNEINGFGGNDTIHGHDGNDRINGGLDSDILHGGAGADTFLFDGTRITVGVGIDQIMDFSPVQDKIDRIPPPWAAWR